MAVACEMDTVTITLRPPSRNETTAPVSYAEVLQHPERFYDGSDIVWVTISSALVFLMIPALSLIYSGLGNRSFAMTMFRLPMITAAFVGFQWVLWGYAVTFTKGILWWGGENRAFRDVFMRPVDTGDGPGGPAIPELLYALYEGMFAAFSAALVCGGAMHRVRPARFIVFISFWSLLVYDPVARWSWSSYGWSRALGTLDFAGGTPVHIVAGTTVAAFAVFCSIESKRSFGEFLSAAVGRIWSRIRNVFRDILTIFHIVVSIVRIIILKITCGCIQPAAADNTPNRTPAGTFRGGDDRPRPVFQPYNVNYLVLGTAILWFGWAGFNGGSALGGNMRAVSAWTSTHVAACSGGVMGMIWVWVWKALPDAETRVPDGLDAVGRNRLDGRQSFETLSVCYFADGAISGLVAITPAAGYVPVYTAPVFGVVAVIVVNMLKWDTHELLRNDPLQVFAVHAGGGVVGMALTAFFADPLTIGLDGHSTIPHPEYTMGQRLGYQLADAFAGMGYTFFATLAILYGMKMVARCFTGRSWNQLGVYDDENQLVDEFQATIHQYWRRDLDELGRPRASQPEAPNNRQEAYPLGNVAPPPPPADAAASQLPTPAPPTDVPGGESVFGRSEASSPRLPPQVQRPWPHTIPQPYPHTPERSERSPSPHSMA